MNAAYDYLQNINSNKSTEKLKKKYYNRFYSGKPIFRYKTKDKWIRNVIKTYNNYFIFVLTNKISRIEAENYLIGNLLSLLSNYNGAKDIDYEEYPSLCSRDLEYRAKLVELIYHPLNHKALLEKFITVADNNRNNPHPYANFIICTNLSKMIFNQNQVRDPKEWAKVDSNTLSCCAKELLRKHTESLNNQGKQQVVSII